MAPIERSSDDFRDEIEWALGAAEDDGYPIRAAQVALAAMFTPEQVCAIIREERAEAERLRYAVALAAEWLGGPERSAVLDQARMTEEEAVRLAQE